MSIFCGHCVDIAQPVDAVIVALMAMSSEGSVNVNQTTPDAPQDEQDLVFAYLGDPTTHGGVPVRRIDTHAAVVFLAGDRAFKVKRAVRFPFLDFSTLEKRKAACEAELAVNRPFAPDIYRRVVAITREPSNRLAIAGSGPPIEWLVEMVRFDENGTLDHIASKGRIDLGIADTLARTVATAHAKAPVVDATRWIDALASYVEQNDAAFREDRELFPSPEADHLTRACRAELARLRPLLMARGQQGLIRQGHGDLHLGNIAIIDGLPVPFDALEFDPWVASGDVLYDLAFLLMDLVERKLAAAASVVLNRYLAQTRRMVDLDALSALPLFLAMRAAIRAKVTAIRRVHMPAEDRSSIATSALTYFRLATALISPPSPTLVAIGGLSGTGKSALAQALAPDLGPAPGAVVLRSDVERKAMHGVDETEPLPPDAYSAETTARVYAALAEKAGHVIAAGHSAIVDAVFAEQRERAAIAAIASTNRVRFQGLFLTADLETRLLRLRTRARDASDADAAVAQRQESYVLGDLNWAEVDASGSREDTLRNAKRAVID
jgi:uncharacterized protein